MPTALSLLDDLIAHWSKWDSNEQYYLTTLAPQIVAGTARLNDAEQLTVTKLRQLLSLEEWEQLPDLLAERRAEKVIDLESDRSRRAAIEEARQLEEEERGRQEQERRREEEEKALRCGALMTRLKEVFASDFLNADSIFHAHPDATLLSADGYARLKARFVREWAKRELNQQLDQEQAAAVASTTGDVQVIARAGSGKTRTLVTRALFLQKHCRVSPRELLLLAFNRRAAGEMKERLGQVLGADLPHVMTFHALAHALVHPEEQIVFDDPGADEFHLSREVQEVINDHIRSESHGTQIRQLMLAHFREDWERIVAGQFQLRMDELLGYRRSLPRETLRGEYVKSFGEKIIANTLFEHGIDYRYESSFRWSGTNYRPDFMIANAAQSGVVVEYFGLAGDPDYDEMCRKKRAFWEDHAEWTFLEFAPRDFSDGEDAFIRRLLDSLRKAGISYRKRSEEEIWQLVQRRALDSFTAAMRSFVGRARKQNLSPGDLRLRASAHRPCSTAEDLFLHVGVSIYEDYLQRLAASGKEDFDGLMWRSAPVVRSGQTRFVRDGGKERGDLAQLTFVLIDEFQDFTPAFFELIDALRSANPGVQFFCVGDDWQAISSFAGAEPGFFAEFDQYFKRTSRRHVRTNYRSATSIVDTGNALMRGKGTEARPSRADPGNVWLCKLGEFQPSAREQETYGWDEITPVLLRLCRYFLDRALDVVVLSRTNDVPWDIGPDPIRSYRPLSGFVERIRSFLPEDDRRRISGSTVHSYKGLEQSAVIVVDAIERRFPLIHRHWVFLRVFGESVEQLMQEEQRLFYVSITRAREALAIVTEERRESPYLAEIQRHRQLSPVIWDDFPATPALDGDRVEIRVYDGYEVRDQLKNLGYHWNNIEKCWRRSAMAEAFSFEALLQQPWARENVAIRVYSETGQLLHSRS